jgi:predicted unusual protein kinase regulating ubiquinone biosynthesis (AarF/ABC1/UbiB family)
MDVLDQIPARLLPRAAATARIAASLGRAGALRLLRSSEQDDRQLGDAMLAELDQLKGIAMKVGQVLSYMDVGLPPETARRLQALQRGSRPLPLSTVAAVIERELGAPLISLFDTFDPAPGAAASIGQVHRATLGGRRLAVKVLYPGVRATIDGDFRNLRHLGRLASLGTAVDGPAIVQELRERMVQECDYRREAAWQQAFAERLADDPALTVPAIVPERSAEAVLTSCWHDGEDFEAVCRASQARRDAVARTLIRFTFGSLLQGGALQADPHPGNFLFPDGDRVVALDFGCVKRFDPTLVRAWRDLSRVVVDGDRVAFPDAARASGQVGHANHFDYDEFWDFQRWLYAPWSSASFRFEPGWLRRGMRWTTPAARNLRHQAMPPAWLWLLRVQAGLHAVLVRLGAQGDFRGAFRECLGLPWRPLAGPEQP